MLDFPNFTKDFEVIADRWAFEQLLKTSRDYRQQRVAKMIAECGVKAEDNLFSGGGREICTRLEDNHENVFA